jgi:sarcosine oxidase subunit gamma
VWRLLSKAARPYGLGIAALESRQSHPVLRLA